MSVEKFVQSCDRCQRNTKLAKIPSVLHPVEVPSGPIFQLWGMDLIGPLKETKNGNKFILNCMEYRTNWAEAFAIPDKQGIHAAKCIKSLSNRFGVPNRIITDQGREFCNELNTGLCKMLNITHSVTAPYHPQANGKIERYNQTLSNTLRKCANDNQVF